MSSKRKRSRRITLLTLIIAVAAMLAMLGLVQAQEPECPDAKPRAWQSSASKCGSIGVNWHALPLRAGWPGRTAAAARRCGGARPDDAECGSLAMSGASFGSRF